MGVDLGALKLNLHRLAMDRSALGVDIDTLGRNLHRLRVDLAALGVDLGALGLYLRRLAVDRNAVEVDLGALGLHSHRLEVVLGCSSQLSWAVLGGPGRRGGAPARRPELPRGLPGRLLTDCFSTS